MGILQMPGFISNNNVRDNIVNTRMASSSATSSSKRANSHIPPPSNSANAGEGESVYFVHSYVQHLLIFSFAYMLKKFPIF